MKFNEQPQEPNYRLGYSVAEFSALFGKHRSWGYRQIGAGNVRPLLGYGEMIISVQEVNRILEDQNGR